MTRKRTVLFVIIAALAYLPLVTGFGYSFDDWYLMWSAKAYGPGAFFPIFSIDRPLRAYLMFPAYLLFGENPLWYNLSAFALRVGGAFCFWWLLLMLWPRARVATLSMALLFVIYPGFLSQPNAIDYQSHIAALTLAIFSLALTVKAFARPEPTLKRLPLLVASAITGWVYLGLMEYYVGFELIRALLVGLLALRAGQTWPARLKQAALDWLPLAIVPFGFVFWRVFIFVGERKATDAGAQLALLTTSPLQTSLRWILGLFHDIFQTVIMAWITPLAQLWPQLTGRNLVVGLALGLLGATLAWMAIKDQSDDFGWRAEAAWLGGAVIFAGLIPVMLANRSVEFPYYSRYTLIASTGVVMFLTALISMLPHRIARQAIFLGLVMVAVLTHFANSVNAANETAAMRNFWWQVAWRAPNIEKNTTLVAQWPVGIQQEDYFVWGPANLIYYPSPQNTQYIQPGIYAAILTPENIQRILSQERQVFDNRRTIRTYANFRNILIFNQPTAGACVHALDNQQMELSAADSDIIRQVAPFSEIEHIQGNEPQKTPPSLVFGPEPSHGWCFYYQKAALARQENNWDEILRLAAQAESQSLTPADPIEWIPFLQAYAADGSLDQLSEIGTQIQGRPERPQICQALTRLNGLSDSTQSQIQHLFCKVE